MLGAVVGATVEERFHSATETAKRDCAGGRGGDGGWGSKSMSADGSQDGMNADWSQRSGFRVQGIKSKIIGSTVGGSA